MLQPWLVFVVDSCSFDWIVSLLHSQMLFNVPKRLSCRVHCALLDCRKRFLLRMSVVCLGLPRRVCSWWNWKWFGNGLEKRENAEGPDLKRARKEQFIQETMGTCALELRQAVLAPSDSNELLGDQQYVSSQLEANHRNMDHGLEQLNQSIKATHDGIHFYASQLEGSKEK